jgi:XTP/dITP diphosphohydrolase
VLTVLLTSPRVAAGLLSFDAWSTLLSASRVLARSAEHPLLPALAAAGILVDVPEAPADLAAVLSKAALDADGPVVWLATPGEDVDAGLVSAVTVPGAHLIDVVGVMDTLRVSCPWDAKQTHESLLPYLLEEAYEAVETVESGDLVALREELGDVLFQAVFHARVAAERSPGEGGFTIDDVADVLVAKLKRRHPHVFGSVSVTSADEVNRNWEEIKKAERAQRAQASGSPPPSVLDGVAFGQPALSLAARLQRRAERAGFTDSPDSPGVSGVLAGRGAPSESSSVAAELGDELMRLVARARAAGTDPEMLLREASSRYAERVRRWERSRAPESA